MTGSTPVAAHAAHAASAAPAADTPSPSPTVSQPATPTSLSGLSAPVRSILVTGRGPVRSIVTTVESFNGQEAQEDTGTTRTLILDSRVLFAEDRAVVTRPARGRLLAVARTLRSAGATGTVRINGYTDDQGSAQHGLVLSRQRAEAVRAVLAPRLAGTGVVLRTRGYGEADPRFANESSSGQPIPANQARNRRVEITFAKPSAG